MSKFFRTYLEQQVEEYERVEQERMEERQIATKKILERMKHDDSMRSMEGKIVKEILDCV